MDLFIIPFAGSFSAHIACLEAGVPYTLQYVDRRTKRLDDGRDYLGIAPKGTVPALRLADESVLAESSAVLQYIADAAPESGLAPPAGTRERYALMEWLNFTTTELHKRHVWPLFSTRTPEEMEAWARDNVAAPLEIVSRHLEAREFVLGERFTVADAYLFWCLFVLPHGGVTLERWPVLDAYVSRMRTRSSIRRAFELEAPLYARQQAA
jgi:glutathione S-transferase